MNEVPMPLPVGVLLARTAHVVLALGGLHVYSTGVEFSILLRVRGRPEPPDWLLEALRGGPAEPGVPAPDGQLPLGAEFADHRTITSEARNPALHAPPGEDELSLRQCQTLGHGRAARMRATSCARYRPGSTLSQFVAWPSTGIAETRHDLDAAAIRDAASRVTVLWPADDEPRPPWPRPPATSLPAGSWFARTLHRPPAAPTQ